MSDYIAELGRALEDAAHRCASEAAVQQRGSRHASGLLARLHRGRARGPASLFGLTAVLVAGATAGALAATGLLSSGSPVPAPRHLDPRAGAGIPARGSSRVLAITARDPAGGPRWGMRIVHTTRGYVCMQVGRLHDGQIGVIGEDGAFHDDGLFHALPTSEVTTSLGPTKFVVTCNPAGVTSTDEVRGLPESGRLIGGKLHVPSAERLVYYGLLGPAARRITYRLDRKTRGAAVEPRTGAYLLVARGTSRSKESEETGASFGTPNRNDGRIRADPPLHTIEYTVAVHDGSSRTCVEGYIKPAPRDPCPRETERELRRSIEAHERRSDLHVPVDVALERVARAPNPPEGSLKRRSPPYYNARVSFVAPFAVDNADSGYSIAVADPNCTNHRPGSPKLGSYTSFVVGKLERDVRRGATVRVDEKRVFANDRCRRPVTIEIFHYDLNGASEVLVGERAIRKP